MTAAPDTRTVDFGRSQHVLRWGGISLRISSRAAVVCAVLVVLCAIGAVAALALGSYAVSLPQLVDVLRGADDSFARTVVTEWRAPRALAAIVFGAALGMSGAVFQGLTNNPLASPDVIGFAAGSYTGALLVIIVLGGGYASVASGALLGGLATATMVYLLAYRGGITGFRLIIVGIGVAAMLGSVNTWLLLRADLEVAMSAATWGAGSLNGITWEQTGVATGFILVLFVGTCALGSSLRQMQLGDDAARALGVRLEPSRLGLVLTGVALTAAVTAAAGPIAFVALAAPQIARRIARTPGITLVPAACTGAALLLAADAVAQHALPSPLPVGVVTVVIGGGYLIWLLIHEMRRHA
ncbi:iron chelate uptake ABC transporter family permease subunit [Nesterenkonia xinjiangensis]